MPTKIASLYAEISAKTDGFEKGSNEVKAGLGDMAKNFLGTAAVIGAFEEALRFSINAAAESEMVNAKLSAVIASTGGAAGMTAEAVDDLATNLSRMSTYDDEAVKSSSALLLTFTNIGQNVFPQAQQAILDMSAALGQDLQSSTIQLGKALNDPIAGITALSRVGVSFTQEQKNMIKTLVETGDTLGAQKIILQELSKEFGGQALAASKTFSGQMQQLKNEVGNLGEAFGNKLIPQISEFVTLTKQATVFVTDNFDAIVNNYNAIQRWVQMFLPLNMRIYEMIDGVQKLRTQFLGQEEATAKSAQTTADFSSAAMNAAAAIEAENNSLKEMSDTYRGMIGTIQSMQDAEERFAERTRDLTEERARIEQELIDLRARGYDEQSEDVQNALDDLDRVAEKEAELAKERERQALEFVSNILMEKLARDGWTQAEFEAFAKQQEAWGLWSADTVAKAQAAWQEADRITASINNIPTEHTSTIYLNTVISGSNSVSANENVSGATSGVDGVDYSDYETGQNGYWTGWYNGVWGTWNFPRPTGNNNGGGNGGGWWNWDGYASGGSFMVPSSYGYEGFRMGNNAVASAGEQITVTPANKDVIDYDRLARATARAVREALIMTGR